MLQSQLFTKTARHAPKDEQSANAQLLIRAGYIDKLMAGVYTYLPLGLRVLKNIENIIREEINAVGGQEVLMPALHPLENYKQTGRENIDVLFRTKLHDDKELLLGQSHEEVVVPLVKRFLSSYKDLPIAVYQIQTKFRNELRAKSGIFRGREFMMKDLYSFHASEQDFESYYETLKGAYKKIFTRAGIGDYTYLTHASGGTFSKFSHEFQTVTKAGEDTIYLCSACRVAVNKEIRNETSACPRCGMTDAEELRSIEVGNIFPLQTRFSAAFDLSFTDEQGKKQPVIMGCYGIGLGRLMGTIVELLHDEQGILWPESVAPYRVHLLSLAKEHASKNAATALYFSLQKQGIPVLYDDREDVNAGAKFADADLLGMPWRMVVSEKTLQHNGVEIKKRSDKAGKVITEEEAFQMIQHVQ